MTPRGWLFVGWLSFSAYCIIIGVPSLVIAATSSSTSLCQQNMRSFLLGYGIAQCAIAVAWLPLIACFDEDATLSEPIASFPMTILAFGSITAGSVGGGVGAIQTCAGAVYDVWAMSLAIFILNLSIATAAIVVAIVFAMRWYWK